MKQHLACSTILFIALAVPAVMSTSQPAAQEASGSKAAPSLNYEFFKTRVEPIFLKKRPGHTRCYMCHRSKYAAGAENTAFRLQLLPPGSAFWTEEQSRLNFEVVSLLVVPGEPTVSRFLVHPLDPNAGGEAQHGGGKQFASQSDPDWQTLAEWVRGQKASGGSSEK